MSVTHVAGPVVKVHNRVVQRCALCGEKLVDNAYAVSPLRLDGSPPDCCVWAERCLVHCDTGRMVAGKDFVASEELPDDFCLALVEP